MKLEKKRDESVNFTLQVYILNYAFRSAQFELSTEAQLTTDQWTAQLIPHYASSWQISDRTYKPDRPDCSHCKLLGKLLDGGVTRLLVCISMSTFAYDWKKKTLPGFTASANNKRKHRSRSCASGTASVTKWSQFQQSILILSSSHGIQLWRCDTNPKSRPKAWFSSHNSVPTWTDWLISPLSWQVNFKFYSRSLKYHVATRSRSLALHAHWNKLPHWVTPGFSALLNLHWTNGNIQTWWDEQSLVN